MVLDTRPAAQFGAGHIPGSIQIGLAGQYASWAGRVLDLDTDLVLVTEDAERVEESRVRLARVGIERVVGYLSDGIASWVRTKLPLEQVPQISVQELYQQLGQLTVLDVRNPVEWESGHLQGATHIPLDRLSKRMGEVNAQRPLAVHCKSGYRSSIAASLLKRNGFAAVMNVIGGFDAWRACQLPYAS